MRILLFTLWILSTSVFAQQKIHVHNDYKQNVPFWKAISAETHSLEVDLILKDNMLYVAHDRGEIQPGRTFDKLYLSPLRKAIDQRIVSELQVLIDIKSEAYATLDKVVAEIGAYPDLVNNKNIRFVISGSRPKPADYIKYPKHILFDYQDENLPTQANILDKIALVSYSFKDYSVWGGLGKIVAAEHKELMRVINNAHSKNKPIRFWATADTKSAWKALSDMGVDYINTDQPYRCSRYFKYLPRHWYKNTVFSKVYQPTFKNDKKNIAPKNIILMIGDGNGLGQISGAVLANGGALTMTQLRSSGLMKTQSADDFTTDSAASGTAIATGQKAKNRGIGVNAAGKVAENITEVLDRYGYVSGCVTNDDIYGATPSAFYAHQKDRGAVKEIVNELLTSKLDLFVGDGGKKIASQAISQSGYTMAKSADDFASNTADKLGYFLEGKEAQSVLKGRGDLLARLTKGSISFLKNKNKPFFLMVEGSLIDTYGHHNNTSGIVSEAIDFDRAVTEAVKFADRDQNTLVIVLADHETGGFAVPQGNMATNHVEGAFLSHDHTGMLVPVFAYGPRSYEFEGCYENSDIFHKILKVLGLPAVRK